MSVAARVRAWMKANPGPVRSGEISDGLGLVGSARLDVSHALRNMFRDGYIAAEGTYGRRQYILVSEPSEIQKSTRSRRRAQNKACQERYYWQRKGMTLEEGRASVAARLAARDAKRAERDARAEAYKAGAAERAKHAEKRRQERDARRRQKDRERKAAQRKAEDKAASAKLKAIAEKVRAAAHTATIQAAIAKPPPAAQYESVESFQARGGRVEVLPAPTYHRPHTIPAREIHHG